MRFTGQVRTSVPAPTTTVITDHPVFETVYLNITYVVSDLTVSDIDTNMAIRVITAVVTVNSSSNLDISPIIGYAPGFACVVSTAF